MGITWVKQLQSGSCHYPTAATKCKVSRQANKPPQWKSMLTHQGWFNLLIYTTFTPTTNYRVCYFHIYLYRCSAPSHYSPLREVSSWDLAWESHGLGNSSLAVVIIPPLPPNVKWAVKQTNPLSGKACSPTKGGFICLYMQPLLLPQTIKFFFFILYLFISVLRTVTKVLLSVKTPTKHINLWQQ